MRIAVHLSELKEPVLNVACERCGKSWTFDVAREIELHGDLALTHLLSSLTRDCPQKANWGDPCRAVFLGLTG